jgi:hypothetical protein
MSSLTCAFAGAGAAFAVFGALARFGRAAAGAAPPEDSASGRLVVGELAADDLAVRDESGVRRLAMQDLLEE